MADIGNEAISFATNFLTQILVIIGGIAAGVKYVLSEIRKGNERLAKKILGDNMEAKEGKGGLLDEIRQQLRAEFKRDLDNLRTEMVGMINDSHQELLNEFKKISIRISYMSRDYGKMEKSLEKISGGRYTAAKEETEREYINDFYEGIGDNDVIGEMNDTIEKDKFNKKRRGTRFK